MTAVRSPWTADRSAARLASYPLRQGSTARIAAVFGVADSRVRHERTDGQGGRLRPTYDLVVNGDGGTSRGLVASLLTAWELAAILRQPTPVLLTRWHQLWYREHVLDADEDRTAALYLGGGSGDDYGDALLAHGGVQIEMEALRLELEARGVDTRGVLIGGEGR